MLPEMKNTSGVIRAFKTGIPPARHKSKLVGSAIGIGIAVFGWYAKGQWPDLPTWVAYGTTAFGFVMVSQDYIKAPFKVFIAMLRDLMAVIRDKKAEPPEESNE